MERLRVYADTSVFGGCFDEEFEEESRALFTMAESDEILLLISPLLVQELAYAPADVRNVLATLQSHSIELVEETNEARVLSEQYLRAGVVKHGQMNDALHVALATVHHADILLSWNFKHMVHFDKIRGFAAVNIEAGYGPIEIRSPLEFV